MRLIILLLLLLAGGCGEQQPAKPPQVGVTTHSTGLASFAGSGRDRLCLKEDEGRAGIITFADQGEANCSLRGQLTDKGIQPDGDSSCTIPIDRAGERVVLGSIAPACAYYCGPGASLEGKTFERMDTPEPATDIAGDPLC